MTTLWRLLAAPARLRRQLRRQDAEVAQLCARLRDAQAAVEIIRQRWLRPCLPPGKGHLRLLQGGRAETRSWLE